mmetsp:Transcript_9171/g.28395  ORF Transcript_9171/g.28395 Transcript_9171/m.28395 type:complete len:258 (-) Transcript_9171:1876-2649(-)
MLMVFGCFWTPSKPPLWSRSKSKKSRRSPRWTRPKKMARRPKMAKRVTCRHRSIRVVSGSATSCSCWCVVAVSRSTTDAWAASWASCSITASTPVVSTPPIPRARQPRESARVPRRSGRVLSPTPTRLPRTSSALSSPPPRQVSHSPMRCVRWPRSASLVFSQSCIRFVTSPTVLPLQRPLRRLCRLCLRLRLRLRRRRLLRPSPPPLPPRNATVVPPPTTSSGSITSRWYGASFCRSSVSHRCASRPRSSTWPLRP